VDLEVLSKYKKKSLWSSNPVKVYLCVMLQFGVYICLASYTKEITYIEGVCERGAEENILN
jgi:hypothetical protein